ncbi:MAG: efflux RND transporter periplasmic adaptor subunit [Planctomycetota bacterium]
MNTLIIAVAAAVFIGPPAESAPSQVVVVPKALVSVIDEAKVSAQEAGVLRELPVVEGQTVPEGALLAKLDDLDALAAQRVAQLKELVAKEEAASDVNVLYSTAAADYAQADYYAADEANKRHANTFPEAEMRKYALAWKRAVLEIEKSKMDKRIAGLQANVAAADVEVANENVRRRQINSPLDGTVIERYRHVGEWVQPGDPLIHVMRLDRLRVEGFLDQFEIDPASIGGREVSVEVDLADKRREVFTGTVVYVKPLIEGGNKYRVWAEVTNRQEDGHWLLRPGMTSQLTIHTGPRK